MTAPLRGSLWLRVRRLLRRWAPRLLDVAATRRHLARQRAEFALCGVTVATDTTDCADDAEAYGDAQTQVDALDDYAYRYWT